MTTPAAGFSTYLSTAFPGLLRWRKAVLPSGWEAVCLPDGTEAIVRPIHGNDGCILAAGLRELSPTSRYQRFLTVRDRLSPAELDYLTSCDGVDHLALLLAVVVPGCAEPRPVGVARCIRDPDRPVRAEVAVTVVDAWQHRGVGTVLAKALAHRAWTVGIREWSGFLLAENQAILKLLDRVGERISSECEGFGTVQVIYRLWEPGRVFAAPEARPGVPAALAASRWTVSPNLVVGGAAGSLVALACGAYLWKRHEQRPKRN